MQRNSRPPDGAVDGDGPALEHRINEHLVLRLIGKKSIIFINERQFIECMRLVLNIPVDDVSRYDDVGSIDEAKERQVTLQNKSKKLYPPEARENPRMQAIEVDISPEEEFRAHASNLQAWYEHGYDTRLLHSNISFPLLRALVEAGDRAARNAIAPEIIARLRSGHEGVIRHLLEMNYQKYLEPGEFDGTSLPATIKDIFIEFDHAPMVMGEDELARYIGDQPAVVVRNKAWFLPDDPVELKVWHNKLEGFDWVLHNAEPRDIEVLKIGFNQIQELPPGIAEYTSLRELEARGNGMVRLCDEIGTLNQLEVLDASDNQLESLPASIGNLHKLRVLVINKNRLTTIPSVICNLENLEFLYCNNNDIKTIPGDIGKLNSLVSIQLHNNPLESIHDAFYSLPRLRNLDVNLGLECIEDTISSNTTITSVRTLYPYNFLSTTGWTERKRQWYLEVRECQAREKPIWDGYKVIFRAMVGDGSRVSKMFSWRSELYPLRDIITSKIAPSLQAAVYSYFYALPLKQVSINDIATHAGLKAGDMADSVQLVLDVLELKKKAGDSIDPDAFASKLMENFNMFNCRKEKKRIIKS